MFGAPLPHVRGAPTGTSVTRLVSPPDAFWGTVPYTAGVSRNARSRVVLARGRSRTDPTIRSLGLADRFKFGGLFDGGDHEEAGWQGDSTVGGDVRRNQVAEALASHLLN